MGKFFTGETWTPLVSDARRQKMPLRGTGDRRTNKHATKQMGKHRCVKPLPLKTLIKRFCNGLNEALEKRFINVSKLTFI